jgi:signal transduction histidine kinase
MAKTDSTVSSLAFKVDAGLIDRLGRELVGKGETAVSELIKNAYDADATTVTVTFIDCDAPGGTLSVSDDGVGMTPAQLESAFMTISSTDKVHNPKSAKYKRNKAGRKGIGRFATQRIGEKLTIITQTIQDDFASKLTIEWNRYTLDTDIGLIRNPLEKIEKTQDEGTHILIEFVRDSWSDVTINRVYRYVLELLQPDYLSDRSKQLAVAQQRDNTFAVTFQRIIKGQQYIIADPAKMLYEKALATIEGYIDKAGDGFCSVNSESLGISHEIIAIDSNSPDKKYNFLRNVHFKAYYYIYNRELYYTNITRLELSNIQRISQEQGGIRVYRNGFRVLPYGEPNNDWLNIDRRYYDESGIVNVPFGNHNLFGFVEVLDPNGDIFQETAGREGLIENDAYAEMKDFISKALEGGRLRIRYGVDKIKKKKTNLNPKAKSTEETEKSPIDKIIDFKRSLDLFINEPQATTEQKADYEKNANQLVEELKEDFTALLQELGMLRVLAGLGLTISEFTHEVVQFAPSMNGDLSVIENQSLNLEGLNALENLKRTIRLFLAYTSYFSSTVSANVTRELKPQQLDIMVEDFLKIISADLSKESIHIDPKFYGYELQTIPMHSSEWSSILFNLYTNSKKAIRRAGGIGEISIIGGNEKSKVYLEFSDNGDGIPEENVEKIFDAFFTTSSPTSFDSTVEEKSTGTGLGLKIVQDILHSYGGSIRLIEPENGFSTCFRVEVPALKNVK